MGAKAKKLPGADKPLPWWEVGGLYVQARTASEARAIWKERTGMDRVPVGVKARRQPDMDPA